VQREMMRSSHSRCSQNGLKLTTTLEALQNELACAKNQRQASTFSLNSQTLAAFGATCIDHGATATGFHANQKAMGTGTADLRWLVSAFHFWKFPWRLMGDMSLKRSSRLDKIGIQFRLNCSGEPQIIANFRIVEWSDRLKHLQKQLALTKNSFLT